MAKKKTAKRQKRKIVNKNFLSYFSNHWQIVLIVLLLVIGLILISYLYLFKPHTLKSSQQVKEDISYSTEEGDYQQVIDGYQELIKREPDNYGNYYSLAKIYQREKDYQNAFENYQKAYQLEESRVEILNLMANCQRDLENYDRAEELYRQAIAESPGLSTPYINLAGMLYSQSQIEQAKNILTEGLRKNPTSKEMKKMLDRLK